MQESQEESETDRSSPATRLPTALSLGGMPCQLATDAGVATERAAGGWFGHVLEGSRLRSALCALRSALCALRSALCALRSALCALRSALCALRSALCALRSALCALRSALCALRSALCARERATSSPRCQVFSREAARIGLQTGRIRGRGQLQATLLLTRLLRSSAIFCGGGTDKRRIIVDFENNSKRLGLAGCTTGKLCAATQDEHPPRMRPSRLVAPRSPRSGR